MSTLILSLFAICIVGFLYFVPTLIAMGRDHDQKLAIFVVNLVGGITGIAWLAALVWSLLPARRDPAHYRDGGWW